MGQESFIFSGVTKITSGAEGSGKQQLARSAGVSGIINLESKKRCLHGTRERATTWEPAVYGQHFSH